MSEHPSHPDPWLDARLRNVPLPIGLLRRLEQVADPEINRLDRALADVPLPDGFLERLADISRVERPSRARDLVERRPWAMLALAASVLLVVGGGYLALSRGGFMPGLGLGDGTMADADRPGDSSADAVVRAPEANTSGSRGPTAANELAEDDIRSGSVPGRGVPAGSDFSGSDFSGDDRNGGEMPIENDLRAAGDKFVEDEPIFDPVADFANDEGRSTLLLWPQAMPDPSATGDASIAGHPVAGSPVAGNREAPGSRGSEAPAAGGAGSDDSPAHGRRLWEVFTTDGRFEELPDLEAVQIRMAHGVKPPLVADYDLRFQLKYGQHPFVRPDANPALRSVQLPLAPSAGPWRRMARSVAEGRLPAPADVRTEDFLAALDYDFPPAPQAGLAIETAAGAAPPAEGGALSLLQVAVHAGEIADEPRAATHLTLVVDCSLSMRRSERWNAVDQALNQLVEHMQPADRLTVVGFSEEAETVVDSESREELLADGSDKLLRALSAIDARPAANLAAGVQLACRMAGRAADGAAGAAAGANGEAAAKHGAAAAKDAAVSKADAPAAAGGAAPARRMLIVSGGRVDSGVHFSQRVQSRLAELGAAGLGATFVDMTLVDTGRAERAAGSLDSWAQAGGARLARAADPNTLGWRLLEGLIGREPVVASHVSLRVTFNPDVVASYRLLGHERATITGPAVDETEVDLRCGETATALFEVTLKPGAKNDVAVVESTWRRPNYGRSESCKKQVVRSQFGVSFASSPPSLQMAAVAALTAETLRGSYFAPANRSLARVADLARRVAKPIQDEPTFRELKQFIVRAEQLRTRRSKPAVEKLPVEKPAVQKAAAESTTSNADAAKATP